MPPAVSTTAPPRPRDVVIVLDRSGSMEGWKMVAARRAVGRLIDTLLDQDRFTVLAFDTAIEYPAHADRKLVDGTNRARWQTLEWLGRIDVARRHGNRSGAAAGLEMLAAHDPASQSDHRAGHRWPGGR